MIHLIVDTNVLPLPPIIVEPLQSESLSLAELLDRWAPYDWHIPNGYVGEWVISACNDTHRQALQYFLVVISWGVTM